MGDSSSLDALESAESVYSAGFMPNQPSSDADLLRAAYAAFNARDIDAALATMAPDVAWPKAFKGGFARGHQEVRAYWTEQWSEINPRVEPTTFHEEAAVGFWSMCIKSCVTWPGPLSPTGTSAIALPSSPG